MADDKTILEIVRLMAQNDLGDDISFALRDGELTAWANCSDVFVWACGDSEEITAENLPLLRQALADLKAVDASDGFATALFAARIRKERPQNALFTVRRGTENDEWYQWRIDYHRKPFPLFAECGPYRPPDFGNPHDLPDWAKEIDPDPAAREYVRPAKED